MTGDFWAYHGYFVYHFRILWVLLNSFILAESVGLACRPWYTFVSCNFNGSLIFIAFAGLFWSSCFSCFYWDFHWLHWFLLVLPKGMGGDYPGWPSGWMGCLSMGCGVMGSLYYLTPSWDAPVSLRRNLLAWEDREFQGSQLLWLLLSNQFCLPALVSGFRKRVSRLRGQRFPGPGHQLHLDLSCHLCLPVSISIYE